MTAEPSLAPHVTINFRQSFINGIRRDWALYVAVIVVVMAIAAMVVSISGQSRIGAQNAQLRRLVECQNNYNEINNERTRQLADATTRERVTEAAADVALFEVVETALLGDRVAARKKMDVLKLKLAEQDAARKISDQERREHPVPPPPNALCGDAPK